MKKRWARIRGFFHCDWEVLWEASDWWMQLNPNYHRDLRTVDTVDEDIRCGYEFKIQYSPYLHRVRLKSNYSLVDSTPIEKKIEYLGIKKTAYDLTREYREAINTKTIVQYA
jgi:ppGpp synthetase/RelA/SpoT-type nucleotidyltranferase